MKCPFCSNEDTKVIDSRSLENDSVTRRRRSCEACSERFTTYEKVDVMPLSVIKSDESRQRFDRDKILKGLLSACHKRVDNNELEQLVRELENRIYTSNKKEIYSKEIGEFLMGKLKKIDAVSYVRFASVYREFKDVSSFIEEVGKVLED